MNNSSNIPIHLSFFDKLIVLLSIYTIIELYLNSILSYSESLQYYTNRVDFAICLLFLYDFFSHLIKAKRKASYLYSHWIDFVSSIPTVGILRIGRIVRIIRVLRAIRSAKVFYKIIDKNNSISTFQSVVVFIIIVIFIASIGIYNLEKDINPFFTSIKDAIWWSFITVTTLGFVQDVAPITDAGKVFSFILIGLGIILIGTFTGMVADYFISDEEIKDEVGKINEKLINIEQKIDELLKSKSDSQ